MCSWAGAERGLRGTGRPRAARNPNKQQLRNSELMLLFMSPPTQQQWINTGQGGDGSWLSLQLTAIIIRRRKLSIVMFPICLEIHKT